MKGFKYGAASLVLVLAALLVLTTGGQVQSGGPYDLTWSDVSCGGATFSQGGPYKLGGTIGQPDAGWMSGGSFSLTGGFGGRGAAGVAVLEYEVYLPLVMR